jgi:hypothetical protein
MRVADCCYYYYYCYYDDNDDDDDDAVAWPRGRWPLTHQGRKTAFMWGDVANMSYVV